MICDLRISIQTILCFVKVFLILFKKNLSHILANGKKIVRFPDGFGTKWVKWVIWDFVTKKNIVYWHQFILFFSCVSCCKLISNKHNDMDTHENMVRCEKEKYKIILKYNHVYKKGKP